MSAQPLSQRCEAATKTSPPPVKPHDAADALTAETLEASRQARVQLASQAAERERVRFNGD